MNHEERYRLASPGYFADLMRTLDEPERDWAIDNAGNVIDMRGHFEWEQMSRHVTVVYIPTDEWDGFFD